MGCADGETLLDLQAALDHYARLVAPLPARRVALAAAHGEVLADAAHAGTDLPPFTQSAMDGYALRGSDAVQPLRVVGEIAAGAATVPSLLPGTALRIFTGGAMPADADTVARQERVRREGDIIHLSQALPVGCDVRQRGEEVRAGAPLATSGQRLHAGLLAALAMAGVIEVSTRPRPRVAVLVSGNEVAPAGTAPTAGRIHDANGPLLRAWLMARGYPLVSLCHVRDDADAVVAALRAASEGADLVISTGGVSVGAHDHLPAAASRAGFRVAFHKVAQRPGKPLWFGCRDRLPLLALPGNPGAVLVGLQVHAAALLQRLEGAPAPLWHRARLARDVRGDSHVALLQRMRCRYDETGGCWLDPLPGQASHMLGNLAQADALAWLPPGAVSWPAGSVVRWLPLVD